MSDRHNLSKKEIVKYINSFAKESKHNINTARNKYDKMFAAGMYEASNHIADIVHTNMKNTKP